MVARVTQDDIFEETSYGDDLELILNGDPDVYFQYNGDDWRNNALQVGVPAIHYSPFSEGPLGSAEQVKFVSLFFNLEARANRYFEPIAEEYNMVKSLAQSQSESPVRPTGHYCEVRTIPEQESHSPGVNTDRRRGGSASPAEGR